MKCLKKAAASIFAAALLMLTTLPFAASAEGTTVGDYTYEVQGGDAVILRYLGDDENVVIPSEIDGKKVTEIGSKSFEMKGDLETVVIPEGVTKLDDHAFAIDRMLETITIPATVTEIGEAAFEQCEGLKTVNFSGDESAFASIKVGDMNELFTAITPNYNVPIESTSASSESEESEASSSEASSSEAASSEEASSAEAASEAVSSEEVTDDADDGLTIGASSSETTSSETTSSESASSASTTTESTSSEETAPKSSGFNIAYIVGGILIGIAVLDIIYFSVKKPSATEINNLK